MNTKAEQVPFQFELTENMTFENFHPGKQPLVVEVCKSLVGDVREQQIYISGAHSHGKTHLLTACCQMGLQENLRIAYLPANIINRPESLLGMEQLDLVCIDDLETLNPGAEIAIFNLINDMRNSGGRIVFASLKVPALLSLQLEDLRSRLSWGPVFQLETLKNVHVEEAFKMRAYSLGLNLPDDVAEFITKRTVRDFTVLDKCLSQLVEQASVSKRRFTIPFVREVLHL